MPATALHALDRHVFAAHPLADLRLDGVTGPQGLALLVDLPSLRGLRVLGDDVDLQPIREHGRIQRLGIGGRRVRLGPLAGVSSITEMWWGAGTRDHRVIAELPQLTDLTISGQTIKGLAFLQSLERLRSLSFAFGGTRDYADLPRLRRLEDLRVWRTRMLKPDDLAPVNRVSNCAGSA
jgi:hypothetical protein